METTTTDQRGSGSVQGGVAAGGEPCPLWERIAAGLLVGLIAAAFFGTFSLAVASRPRVQSTAVAVTTDVEAAHSHGAFSLRDVAPAVAAHYEHAAGHPDVYAAVPCYCGCDSFADHAHLLDCFVRPDDGSWDAHAAYCGICQEEAVVVRRLLEDGRSTPDIRADIVDRFGPTTNPAA